MEKTTKRILVLAGAFAAAAATGGYHYVFGEKETICDSKKCGLMVADLLTASPAIRHRTKDNVEVEFPTIRITYHANGVFYRQKGENTSLVRPSDAQWLVANVAEEEFDRIVTRSFAKDLLKNQKLSQDVLAGMQKIMKDAPIVVTKVDITAKLKGASVPSHPIK